MKSIITTLLLLSGVTVFGHGGEVHTSAPSNTSRSDFGSSSGAESPFSMGFKLRSGYEYGSYLSALPSINSFFGSDELSLNMNYEFQIRNFNESNQSTSQASDYQDQDYNNRFVARVKKSISEKLDFNFVGAYVLNQAVRVARMINDYNYYSLNSNLAYKLENEWSLTAGYLFGVRQFPNGTYLVPTSSPSGVGEPISPTEQPTASDPITLSGVMDNSNEMSLAYGGELGEQTISFQGKYIINNSDVNTRKYNAQIVNISVERFLFARILAQLSYSLENRAFTDRVDKINTADFSIQKDLSARMTILGLARNMQLVSEESSSNWEGYAQLQYAF